MSSSTASIELRDVRFAYKAERPVVAIDALHVDAGRRVFLHGPSGSGKSTLLSLIAGILLPQQGEVLTLGRNLSQMGASARDSLRGSDIGYIFQSFNLIPYLTVEENIALPCKLHAGRRARMQSSDLHHEVLRLARRLDIEEALRSPIQELSIGQQQRVAIARAIIGTPPLVIADEPTSSLDQNRRESFLDLLNEMIAETQSTLLFVSHDLTIASHFDEVISLPAINHATASRNAQ
jgi:putative ABC transport system ATP-binding protein